MAFANTWNVLKNYLKDNISDPKNRYKVEIVKSTRGFPSATDFVGYPYVVVNPVELEEEIKSNDGTIIRNAYRTVIEILGTDNPSMDSLSDQILNLLIDKSTLNSLNIKNSKISDIRVLEDNIEGKRIYIRQIIFTFTD